MKARAAYSSSVCSVVCALLLLCALPAAAQTGTAPEENTQDEAAAEHTRGSEESAAVAELATATGQDLRITVESVEPASVLVGETAHVTVLITVPPGAELVSLVPWGNRFVEGGAPEVLEEGAGGVVQMRLPLVVFRPGVFEVPGLRATWLDANGEQRRTVGGDLSIEVQSIIANESNPALSEPGPALTIYSHNKIPVYVGAGILAGLMLGLAFFYYRRREELRIAAMQPPPPPPPPHETALAALDQLQTANLIEQEQHLEFHMRLSEILREFVGATWGFHAIESTTGEILDELRARPREVGDYATDIETVLVETDIVKFARYVPEAEHSDSLYTLTRGLVESVAAREMEVAEAVPDPPQAAPESVPEPSVESSAASSPRGRTNTPISMPAVASDFEAAADDAPGRSASRSTPHALPAVGHDDDSAPDLVLDEDDISELPGGDRAARSEREESHTAPWLTVVQLQDVNEAVAPKPVTPKAAEPKSLAQKSAEPTPAIPRLAAPKAAPSKPVTLPPISSWDDGAAGDDDDDRGGDA